MYVPPTSHAVAQMCEALSYKPECHRFDFQWRHWDFSLNLFFRPHYGSGVDSACNWNDYLEYFLEGREGRCVGLTNLPLTGSDFLEIWETEPLESIRACPGLYMELFTTTLTFKNSAGCPQSTFMYFYDFRNKSVYFSHGINWLIIVTEDSV